MKRLLVLLLMLPVLCSCRHYEIDRYDPPGLLVVTQTGEYTAVRFGYKWERERKEDAVDYVDPSTYEYEPITIAPDESCYLRFGRGFAPEMYIIRFYPENGGDKQIVDYTLNPHGGDPRFEGDSSVLLPVTESGIFTVEAVWPEWVTNSVVTDATYGFSIIVSDAE